MSDEKNNKNDDIIAEGKKKAEAATSNAIKAANNALRKNHVVTSKGPIKRIEIGEGESGFVVIEFTKPHGTHDVGEKETYHHSTAAALVNKLEVAKVVEKLKKYVPKKAKQ
jgi:hypothetical protein